MFNEEDKKYLKENVEKKLDNLDKKITSSSDKVSSVKKSALNPNSEIGKKLNAIYKKQQDEEDKQKYYEELEKKVFLGQATLAEKVEMLKLDMDKKLPDEFKDGMKAMTDTMKKGGNQAMQGVNHLVGRAMMSNPLTAMIWQNRDILKAVGDIGMGGLKMGLGALGALGKGTAGLLKASVNMFKKKPKTEDEDIPKQEEISEAAANQETEENTEDEEKTTAQKITEIHDLFFKGKFFQKQETEEKSRQSILSKGLTGLGKTMKTVSGIVETIMAKQKLILGGLMLGAVGILALVGWFKNGGMQDALTLWWNKTKNSKNALVPKGDTSDVVSPERYAKDAEAFKGFQENLKDIKTEDVVKQITKSNKGVQSIEEQQTGKVTQGLASLMGKPVPTITNFKIESGAPYILKDGGEVIEITRNKTMENEFDVRFVHKNHQEIGGFMALNVVSPHLFCVVGEYKEKGSQIGFIGKNGYANFRDEKMTEESKQEYIEMVNNYAKDNYSKLGEDFSNEFTDKRKKQLEKSSKNLESHAKMSKKVLEISPTRKTLEKVEKSVDDAINKEPEVKDENNVITDTDKPQEENTPETPKTKTKTVPYAKLSEVNDSDSKIQNQQSQLKEVEKPITTKEEFDEWVKEMKTKSSQNNPQISMDNSSNDQPAELLSVAQYNRACEIA